MRFSDQQTSNNEEDEFAKTMVIPAGEQNEEKLVAAERAAEVAAKAEAPASETPVAKVAPRDDIRVNMPESQPENPAPVAETVEPVSHTKTSHGIDPSNAPKTLPMAKLQVLSGSFAGRELKLTKALTTLGRRGIQVAAITRRAEGYFIVVVESGGEGDYPLVNGQPIGAQAQKINDNDVVQIAGVKMGFFHD